MGARLIIQKDLWQAHNAADKKNVSQPLRHVFPLGTKTIFHLTHQCYFIYSTNNEGIAWRRDSP